MDNLFYQLIKRFIDKIFSARFIITLMFAYVFCRLALEKIVPAETVILVIWKVIDEYYQRKDRHKNEKENQNINNNS